MSVVLFLSLLAAEVDAAESVSLPDDVSFTAARRQQSEAEQRFAAIMSRARHAALEPDERERLLSEMAALCERFPGSAAATRCAATVRSWMDKGLVSPEAAQHIISASDRMNPARDELKELQHQAQAALAGDDHNTIRQIIDRLETISTKHPGTLSQYTALASLPTLYRRLGENRRAREAAVRFLRDFPPDRSASLPSYSHYQFTNVFLLASLLAADSVPESLDLYRRIVADNEGNAFFSIPALYDGGVVAMRAKMYDDAERFFLDLAEHFEPSEDNRVILARFKLLEIDTARGELEKALTLATALRDEFRGGDEHWERLADRWVTSLNNNLHPKRAQPSRSNGTTSLSPVPDPLNDARRKTGGFTETTARPAARTILLLTNGAALILILSFFVYRVFWRTR